MILNKKNVVICVLFMISFGGEAIINNLKGIKFSVIDINNEK